MSTEETEIYPEKIQKRKAIRDQVALCGMQATYWSVITMQSSFLVSFLTQNGYSTSLTALIVFINAIANLIAQPIWGYLADAKLGIKRVILCCLGFSIPALALMPFAVPSIFFTLILNIMYASFNQPLQGLTDAITNISAARNKYVTYGYTRGIGSLAAAVSSLFVGKLLNITGIAALFYINAGLLLIAFLMMLMFSGAAYGMPAGNAEPRRRDRSISIRYAASVLVKNRAYVFLVISNTLIYTSNRLSVFYVPILINEFGGTSGDLGMALFLNCILMAPCMVLHGWLMKKHVTNHVVYIAAGLFMCLRAIGVGFSGSLRMVVGVQILQSFGYGLLQPSMVEAVSEVSPFKLRATAISLATAIQVVLSTLIGSNLGSICVADLGRTKTFMIYTMLSLVGVLFYIPVMRSKRGGEEVSE